MKKFEDNPFNFIEDGIFVEPIKNPFSCEAAYEEACSHVLGIIKVNEEVGNDVTVEKQMMSWLDKLSYEYI
ncbi:Phage protein [Enterococcus phage vB_EfaS_140]|uniref:Phage protein n=1 Tax=Enterococcus phage vB_EfaS_140 TaxID=2730536 RepID=A0ACA9ASG5_9CAUD|nr:Phage protein [Enterococcus phage vB_EfaS_140]